MASYGRRCSVCGGLSYGRRHAECVAPLQWAPNPRQEAIIGLWRAGLSLRAIAEEVSSTPGAVGVSVSHMRKRGVDLPHRYGLEDSEQTFLDAVRRDPCAYCGAPSTDLDHIVSRLAGGLSGWSNLTAACDRCNSSKSNHSLLGYLSRIQVVREQAVLEAERRRWNEVGATGR